jgi:hypothetical protein
MTQNDHTTWADGNNPGILNRFLNWAGYVGQEIAEDIELRALLGLAGTFTAIGAAAFLGAKIYTSDATGNEVLWHAQSQTEKIERLLVSSHEQYLIGLHSGMLAAGIDLSQKTNDRITPFLEQHPNTGKYTSADDLALFELRTLGAIAGAKGHSEADLVAYLDYVEGLSDNLLGARVTHEQMFNDLPGISSGDRLAKIAQSVAILADDMFEDATAEEALDSILKSAFDEGYEPSQQDLDALRNVTHQAMAEVNRIAETEDILVAAKTSLMERNMSAFSRTGIKAEDVIVACPFGLGDKTPTDAEQRLTSDDTCEPGK